MMKVTRKCSPRLAKENHSSRQNKTPTKQAGGRMLHIPPDTGPAFSYGA